MSTESVGGFVDPAPQAEVDSQMRLGIRPAGQAYFEGVNEAFMDGGDDADPRLCGGCPMTQFCGPAVNAVTERYDGDGVPRKDREMLSNFGVEVDNAGFGVCPAQLIENAVVGTHVGAYRAEPTDPLYGSTPAGLAIDTLRVALKDIGARLDRGIRL